MIKMHSLEEIDFKFCGYTISGETLQVVQQRHH